MRGEGEKQGHHWPLAALGALAALGVIAWVGAFAAPASAAGAHVLDPLLSLGGDCTVSGNDPVPDPGCPGGSHPPEPFNKPCGVAVDRHGYVYVATPDIETREEERRGRIDVFDPAGGFVLEIESEGREPCALAVDSQGSLYVREYFSKRVALYRPDAYPPAPTSDYGEPELIACIETLTGCKAANGVAVDPADDHLYVSFGNRIVEYGSAAEGNPALREIGLGEATYLTGVDVWGANHDVYASGVIAGTDKPENPANNRVFVFDGETGELKLELNGSSLPDRHFGFTFGKANLAVDQSNGDVYVLDTAANGTDHLAWQLSATGALIGRLPSEPPDLKVANPFGDIALDAPIAPGEEGYESPNEGYAFVAAGNNAATSHLWAYRPCPESGPPGLAAVSFSAVTASEATLRGTLDPRCLDATYRFEYTTQAAFEAQGWAGAAAVPVPDGELGAAAPPTEVSAPIAGLAPGAAYHFRLVAASEGGSAEAEGRFATYPPEEGPAEGRAYELVTPPDTGGRIPGARVFGQVVYYGSFAIDPVAAGGEELLFGVEGGSLAGIGAGGGFDDTYRARRGAAGWRSAFSGMTGAEAREPHPGGFSADHGLSFWEVRGEAGSLVCEEAAITGAEYIRREAGTELPACGCDPQARGRIEAIGCGSLATDPSARGHWISPGGGHVIFSSDVRLEPAGSLTPPSSDTTVGAVYDRAPDGTTRVASLLPGDLTPPDGSLIFYRGASRDGSAVAFEVEGALYVRVGNRKTLAVGEGVRFGGLSADGSRLFYLVPNEAHPLLEGPEVPGYLKIPQGEVFALDTQTGEAAAIGSGGEAVLVNVAAGGTAAYFTSTEALSGAGENEWEDAARPGEDNLYRADGEAVGFVATLDRADVIGRAGVAGESRVGGLGLWATHVLSPTPGSFVGPGSDPSRSTPEGRVLLFESGADLTPHESGGRSQVYRYDDAAASLRCLSCNPTGAAAASDARLQSDPGLALGYPYPPVNAMTEVANLSEDGRRAFFQSAERLVAGDRDGRLDVYGWRARGADGCERQGGCLALISAGRSAHEDYLYAVSADGRDVFFQSNERLLAEDADGTPSIYDARVGGGFAAPAAPATCAEDICQGPQPSAPPLPGVGGSTSASFRGPGNARPRRCAKGKRRVRRGGRARCVSRRALRRRARRACRNRRRGAARRRCVRRQLRRLTGARRRGGGAR